MREDEIDQLITKTLGTGPEATTFRLRWNRWSPALAQCLAAAYPGNPEETLQRVLELTLAAAARRPDDLRVLDEQRLLNPDWLQRPEMIGYVCYTDRFAGTLAGITGHLDHLRELNVGYLHLMPLLMPREGENDGGYAVADYTRVRPDLGTMDDLENLTRTLRGEHISLVVDLVLNHVAQEHEWAERARAGEQRYLDYFLTFADRTQPDEYERTLPEVFPDFAPGNFTFDEALQRWVWTTFNSYQWDVNWANPDVFCEYLAIILDLANRGVEVLRLDAIAFIWKQLGTTCQNLPTVHDLTEALRAAARIVAPALAFKAEAIVAPDDLIHYLGTGRHTGQVSDMAYHNTLMVQLWSSLASRDAMLAETALRRLPAKPTSTTWGTYVRCHDDIGWAVMDEDAAAVGLNGHAHRHFLSDFYSGEFPGSFARGLVFQANPATGDRRISGSLASLAGLETAVESGDPGAISFAVDRILLLHAAILGWGGVPLLYMGDELGLPNDDGFAADPAHAADNRWVHRPSMPWELVDDVHEKPDQPAGWVFQGIRHLVGVRRRTPQLHASVESTVLPSPDHRVLLVLRQHPLGPVVQMYNFGEDEVWVPAGTVGAHCGAVAEELISGDRYDLTTGQFKLWPLQAAWFVAPSV